MPKLWTPQETATLVRLCESLASTPRKIFRAACAALPARKSTAIRKKLANLGLNRTLKTFRSRPPPPPWTEKDLADLEAICKAPRRRGEKARLAVWKKLTKRFPDRTLCALRNKVYERNFLPQKWSAAEKKILQREWGVATVPQLLGWLPRRNSQAIVEMAHRMGLERAAVGDVKFDTPYTTAVTPQGYASVSALARCYNFEIGLFKKILRAAEVPLKRFGYYSKRGYLHADVDDAKSAVARWLHQETPAMAARRLGVSGERVWGWVRKEGENVVRDRAGRSRGESFRRDPSWYDALWNKHRPIPEGFVGVAALAARNDWGYDSFATRALLMWAGATLHAAYPENKKNRSCYVSEIEAYAARAQFQRAENLRDAAIRLRVRRHALSIAYKATLHAHKPYHKFLALPEVWTEIAATLPQASSPPPSRSRSRSRSKLGNPPATNTSPPA
jgi:hypothetical protein